MNVAWQARDPRGELRCGVFRARTLAEAERALSQRGLREIGVSALETAEHGDEPLIVPGVSVLRALAPMVATCTLLAIGVLASGAGWGGTLVAALTAAGFVWQFDGSLRRAIDDDLSWGRLESARAKHRMLTWTSRWLGVPRGAWARLGLARLEAALGDADAARATASLLHGDDRDEALRSVTWHAASHDERRALLEEEAVRSRGGFPWLDLARWRFVVERDASGARDALDRYRGPAGPLPEAGRYALLGGAACLEGDWVAARASLSQARRRLEDTRARAGGRTDAFHANLEASIGMLEAWCRAESERDAAAGLLRAHRARLEALDPQLASWLVPEVLRAMREEVRDGVEEPRARGDG